MRSLLLLTLGFVGGYYLHGKRDQTIDSLATTVTSLFLGPEKE